MFLYTDLIYRPILNLLILGYNYLPGHDIGIVIILVTVLIRFALAPLFHKQLKSQKAMSDLQPKLQEVQKKYENDREARAKAMLELYQTHKVNPFSSCLPLIIQLPILFALYHVFVKALSGDLNGIYSFVTHPGRIDPLFIGLMDLSKPSPALSILAGVLQYFQSRLMAKTQVISPSSDPNDVTTKALKFQTTYILPIISVVIAWNLPAGLPLYWCVTTIFAIAQQEWVNRRNKSTALVT